MAQLPAGMRNNNPGNIKYIGQPGTTPSINTDQGDPQAVYASPEAGMAAMYQLLRRKYGGGKRTPAAIIAGQGGWTPGNMQAAQNIARAAGIDVNADIGLDDPVKATKFMRALMLQEHGEASNAYTDAQIQASISGSATPDVTTPSGGARHPPNPKVGTGYTPEPIAPTVVVAPQPMEAPSTGPVDTRNPWSSLASGLASRAGRDNGMLSGGGQEQAPLPTPEFASALPQAAPAQPVGIDLSPLADLFGTVDIGQAAAMNVDPYGNPIRRRQYG